MARKIFVNYRRQDEPAEARNVRDRLARVFGERNVFMDVDDLEPGQRFEEELEKALAQCDVFLPVIGPRWLKLLDARGQNGDPDYVRQEVAGALARGNILIIPVLVAEAQLPRRDRLPEDIRALTGHQAHDLRHKTYGRDMAQIIAVIKSMRRKAWHRWRVAVFGAGAAILCLAIGIYYFGASGPPRTALKDLSTTGGLVDGQAFRDCKECPEMVVVPAGEFLMGSPESESGRTASEGPQHNVRIGKRLAVGKFEVTVEEYEAFIVSTGGVADGGGCNVWTAYGHRFEKDRSFRTPSFSQSPRQPVVCVSWQAATTYTNWLTTQTGKKYRLLSEAEWEYAARAGSTGRYFFGDSEGALCEYGNGADRTSAFLWGNHLCSDGVGVQTATVGRYKPNAFGLHDTIGNASEWVQDCLREDYRGAPTDGAPWMSGNCSSRVIRGGSWDNGPKDLRSATRGAHNMQGKDNIGFRVAREVD
jgi:formylglycine-generating enzyme required for sulfatase activity